MTADNPNDYPYVPVEETTDPQVRKAYWDIAKGLQKVDGLETSPYLDALESEHVSGKLSIEETGQTLRKYYRDLHNSNSDPSSKATPTTSELADQQEADLVSQRIVELLSSGAFFLDSQMLNDIHKHLFQDLDEETYKPGTFMEAELAPIIREEHYYNYGVRFDAEQIDHLSRFLLHIWQLHPFVKGRTQTVATFAALHLNSLGFNPELEFLQIVCPGFTQDK